jgi:hypothetical protein
MSTPIFEALLAAEQGRDQAFANLDAADKAAELEAILGAIEQAAASGQEFTANDVRPHLPEGVNRNRIGRAFYRAIELGIVEVVALDRSNKANTHRARINRYRATWAGRAAS